MATEFNKSEFVATFKAESEEHLGKLSKDLVALERTPGSIDIIKELFRVAHTLKGVARMMGFIEIQEIAHRIEDIFGAITEKKLKFTPGISNKIFSALDSIKIIIDKIVKGEKIDINVALICSDLEGCIESKKRRVKKQEGKKEEVSHILDKTKIGRQEKISSSDSDSSRVSFPATEEYVRVSLRRVSKLLNLVGEMVINKIKASQKIIALKKITRLAKDSQKRLAGFFEEFKNNEDFKKCDNFKTALASIHQCNVDAEKIKEEMLDIFENISNEAIHMDPIVSELQDRMKEIRMLPCFTVFDSFPRLVRDITYEQGKKINLVIDGAETELDKKVLEGIKAPLMHILRNCIDHGIEEPKDRLKLGKNEEGVIKLSASQEGGQVVIRVEDDGQGLDLEKIKRVLIEKKLRSEAELNNMNEEEVSAYIFKSGFSTSPIITDISGRGIGLDIVKTQMDRLKGKVDIDSERGKGTKVTLELPLTIAIMDVLLVGVSNETFALPMLSVEEILEVKVSEISTVENKMAIQVRDHTVPIVRLDDILGIVPGTEEDRPKRDVLSVIIATFLEKKVGFIVDSIVGEQEVFIKSLGSHLGKIRNVSGATILGIGKVIVILDVADLIASSRVMHPALTPSKTYTSKEKSKKRILVIEDALTTRELEQSILESQGYSVDTAIDGLEALDKLAQVRYNLIVCDVQMPRMDGFEFCKTFRKDKQYKEIPVVFVTALAKEEDKRRGIEVGAQAYIVKSAFDQMNLIDTVERLIE